MKKFSDLHITTQFILALVGFAILPIVGYLFLYFYQSALLLENTQNQLLLQANIERHKIDALLVEQKKSFSLLTQSFSDSSHLLLDEVVLESSVQEMFPDYVLVDASGNTLFTHGETPITLSSEEETTARTANAPSMILENAGTSRMSFLYTAPLVFTSGESGFVIARAQTKTLNAIVLDYQSLSTTGELQLFYRLNETFASVLPFTFLDGNTLGPNDYRSNQGPITNALVGEEGVYSTFWDYRGREVLLASIPLDYADWVLVTKIDRDEVLLFSNSAFTQYGVVVALGMLGFTLIFIVYFYFFTIRPLREIIHIAVRIQKGHFFERVHLGIKSKNEIGLLANAFTAMTKKLVESNEHLAQTVDERTASLNTQMRELKRNRAKDEALIGSIGEGMIVTDQKGRVTFLNKAVQTIFDWKQEEVLGMSVYDVIPLFKTGQKSISQQKHPAFASLSRGKQIRESDFFATRANGDHIPVSLNASPILLNNKVRGVVLIVRDTSKEHEIARMKEEFIGIASHQLRGPIASIKWYGELLEEDQKGLSKEQKDFVRRINVSTVQMIALVDDFLNVSRVESGQVQNNPEEVIPSKLIENILEIYHHQIVDKQLKVEIQDRYKNKKIVIDSGMIREIYANLISNAVKYSKNGGEVELILSEKEKQLIFQVKDVGEGIPKADQPKVFSKFFRASNIVLKGYKGTGLGLYTVAQFVERLHGRVGFESKEDKGSTFWVALPIKYK